MKFFDCNACFGRSTIPEENRVDTAEALVAEMEFRGVSEALVYHVSQREENPIVGNELLIREIEGADNLHPVLAILPSQTGEIPISHLIDQMKEHKAKALRAFPLEHKYLLDSATFEPILEVLIERSIPLILQAGTENWQAVAALLKDWPMLTVIAVDHGRWGEDRYFRPLIEKYPNFYIDSSGYELDQGIEDLCKKYGPSRLLFGSGYPATNMGGPVMTLLHADIPDSFKEAIAGGNLRALLGGVVLEK